MIHHSQKLISELINFFCPGETIEQTQSLSLGNQNTNIRVKTKNYDLVLRIWGSRHSYIGIRQANDILYEIALMDFFRAHGFMVPHFITSPQGQKFSISKIERKKHFFGVNYFIEGKHEKNYTQSMIKEVAHCMAHMHLVAPQFVEPCVRRYPGTTMDMTFLRIEKIKNYIQRNVPDDTRGYVEWFQSLSQHFATQFFKKNDVLQTVPRAVIHGDLMYENIKFKSQKIVGIFDFDNCRISHLLEDIVKSIFDEQFRIDEEIYIAEERDRSHIELFLKEYETIRPLTNQGKKLLSLFFLSRLLYQVGRNLLLVFEGRKDILPTIAILKDRYEKNKLFFEEEFYT